MNIPQFVQQFYSFLIFLILSTSAATAQDLKLLVDNKTVTCASQSIEINITAENFTELTSISFSVNWNPDVIAFKSVSNLNSRLSSALFNTQQSETENGAMSFSWFDSNPVTLPPNDNILFTLIFDSTGQGNFTDIEITDNPTTVNYSDSQGNNQPRPQIINGAISTDCGNSNMLTFQIPSSQQVCHNGIATMDVTTRNFSNISSFAFSVHWDESQLNFERVEQFNNSIDINSSDFNTRQEEVNNGRLGISWFSVQEKNLPDDALLFRIVFSIPLNSNLSTNLTFAGDPAQISASTDNGKEQIVPNLTNGQLQLSSDCSSPLVIEAIDLATEIIDNQHIKLRWEAHSMQHFIVERSTNGIDFTSLGTVAAESNPRYSFVDYFAPAGELFYRVQQISPNAATHYSLIKRVLLSTKQKLVVSPNPTKNYLKVSSEYAIEHWRLLDAVGQVVPTPAFHHSPYALRLNVADLPVGLYFMWIETSAGKVTERVIVQ